LLHTSLKSSVKFQGQAPFTPLESPSIYVGDGENRKHQFLIEGKVKALPFQTGFTASYQTYPPDLLFLTAFWFSFDRGLQQA
jgi:hypothetical protein